MSFDDQRDSRGDARPDVRGEPQACGLPFGLACGMACVRPDMRPDTRGGVRGEPGHSPQGAFCEYGFSALQINVLALIQRAGARVTPYERIARKLAQEFGMQQSTESVRGIVNRLAARGFIRRKPARDGTIRGVCFTTVEAMFCPHIIDNRSGVRGSVRAEALPGSSGVPSILEEKIERENLSFSSEGNHRNAVRKLEALTEDDLAYHWPNLVRAGFGTCQIRQIIERLDQVGIGVEKVMQGLAHAEWELENGTMRDKSGQQVSNPVSWVFTSLAKHGYYRRPEGYVSPQEQAEHDAAEEAKRIVAACETRQKAELDAWVSGLSPEERAAIISASSDPYPIPEDAALRLHFKAQVWPEVLAKQR
ncbi:MAG: hypothetical protein DELT_00816 [Desulfovibrio sp.]